MKKLCILSLCLMLTSCYYKNGCFYAPQSVTCSTKYKGPFAYFDKDGLSNGQKLEDMKMCLGEHKNDIDVNSFFYSAFYKKRSQQEIAHKFTHCMINKGYVFNDKI